MVDVGAFQRRAGVLALVGAGLEAVVRGSWLFRMAAGDAGFPQPLLIDWAAFLVVVGLVAIGGAWLLGADERRARVGAGIVGSIGALAAVTIPATLVAVTDLPADRGLLLLGALGALTAIVLATAGGFAVVSVRNDPRSGWEWPFADPPLWPRLAFLGSSLVVAITINTLLTDGARLASGVGVQSGVDLVFRQLPPTQLALSLLSLAGFVAIGVFASGVRPAEVTVGAGTVLVIQGLQYVYGEVAVTFGWTTGREPTAGATTGFTAWLLLHVLALVGLLTSMFLLVKSAPPAPAESGRQPSRAAG
ncbi:MAG TPA: hypothetical protein VHF25_16635 [Nitriliruptorales bacterium]|nr:hypothetical protein [Nitriliruptorales bacterium]